jgi:uncharacterized repeat protein (TIGR01451 family)
MKKYLLLLFAGLLLSGFNVNAQSLVSAIPNNAQVGTTLTTTITGSGTFFQNSSPQGNVNSIYIQQGGSTYYADFFAIFATDDTHVDASIVVPGNAPLGSYNLYVEYFDPFNFQFFTLPLLNGIIVGPPDGYIQGKVFDDANGNGILDGGETGLAAQTVNVSTYGNTTTDANGDFSVGVLNGSYTVSFVPNTSNYLYVPAPYPSSYPVIISSANSPGNDFATAHALVSVYPDSAYVGQTISVTISSNDLFTPGSVSNTGVSLSRTQAPTGFNSVQVTYVDTNTIIAKFNVPNNVTYLGTYNIRVYNSSGLVGYHYLNNGFTIVNAPIYMNGIVYYDADSNGVKAAGETGVGGGKLLLTPDSSYSFSDNNGNYSFGTTPGAHTITWVPQPNYQLSIGSPASYTATVNTTTSGYDFGLKTNYAIYADSIRLGACWSGCAHPNTFQITYENIGLIAYDGYVYMVLDSINMIPSVGYGTPPDSVIGDTLFWNFTNLQPFHPVNISAYIDTPIGGDTIQYSVTMVALDASGNIAFTSTDSNVHVVSCSMDPNEKHVQPEGIFSQHYTLKTDELLYTIIFQNTGTDTAYTVIIRDTIDNNLDLNTLQVFSSSAAVNTEISLLTRVAKFTFNNILLVDSNHNEPASHGFIRYSIRAKQGVADNTIVYNNAGIYFDFNLPVITNTTYNTLVTTLPVGLTEYSTPYKGTAVVIPNPFTETATLVFDNRLNELYDLNVFSVTGKSLYHYNTSRSSVELHRNTLSAGIYFYELKNKVSGRSIKGKFVIN